MLFVHIKKQKVNWSTELEELIWTRLSPSSWTSLVAQAVKNLPAMQKTQVQSLGREDPLEKGMATHSSILVWKSPIDIGAWRVHGVTKSWHNWAISLSTLQLVIHEKNSGDGRCELWGFSKESLKDFYVFSMKPSVLK